MRVHGDTAKEVRDDRSQTLAPPKLAGVEDEVEDIVRGQLVRLGAVPVDDPAHGARLVHEEVGGPVVPVDPACREVACADDLTELCREPLEAARERSAGLRILPGDRRCEGRRGRDALVHPP